MSTERAEARTVAEWVADFLVARGVDRIFGLQGGHIQPIWDHLARKGVRIIDVRDEGAAVHMAHAHAVLSGGIGVASVTAGPGVTNCVTAMANAQLERVPVLLIGGCAPMPQDDLGPLQGIDHVSILRPVTRSARTLRIAGQTCCVTWTRRSRRHGATAMRPVPCTSRSRPTCCGRPCPRASCCRNTWRRARRARFRPTRPTSSGPRR